ncbi:hypothetical protein [Haloferula sp.]|uniref:hypothetical protein n=1 Tax=Haloferula sp. TaxID=2497595 RepID=UPI003C73E424
MIWLQDKIQVRTVITFSYQPALRPALPCVYGPLDYREQRALFQHIDNILSSSGLEEEFITLTLTERGIDMQASTAVRLERFAKYTVLALRTNIVRNLTGLDHRDFATRLADSPLLQWFLRVGEMGSIKAFSKSTSDRLSRWVGEPTVRVINEKLTALLATSEPQGEQAGTPSITFGLAAPIRFDDIYFDSTCIKADIHFPIDWVLLRDAARTLMKATTLIRKHGLKHRMPQEPLAFLSDMNTLCMKMTAKRHAVDGRKHRKKVLREMKALEKRIAAHARAHVGILKSRREETDLTEPQAQLIIKRIDGVLEQLPAAIKQAHERIIGERRVSNESKIISLYDDQINVIKRGKAGAQVEFGNKLWLGETREGIIADYQFYQDNPSDTALVKPAIERLMDHQQFAISKVWGDRGLASKPNTAMLDQRGIGNGLCPRDVGELAEKLANQDGFREGLKRRAATEGRIGIFKNVFLGGRLLAKGFEHRQLAVGWAVLTHNLWVLARMAEAERRRKEEQEHKIGRPSARAA